MSQTRAWLLQLDEEQTIAVSNHHMAEYLLEPELIPTPVLQPYTLGMLDWRDSIIPVIDLLPFLYPGQSARSNIVSAIVLAYQEMEGKPLQYAGLGLHSIPSITTVDESQACPIPPDLLWQTLAGSCFSFEEQSVPIVKVSELFSSALPLLYEELLVVNQTGDSMAA